MLEIKTHPFKNGWKINKGISNWKYVFSWPMPMWAKDLMTFWWPLKIFIWLYILLYEIYNVISLSWNHWRMQQMKIVSLEKQNCVLLHLEFWHVFKKNIFAITNWSWFLFCFVFLCFLCLHFILNQQKSEGKKAGKVRL